MDLQEQPPEVLPAESSTIMRPRVNNATRVVVGFPFATVKIQDSDGASTVAELVAGGCRALADQAPAAELREIAEQADELATRLRRN